MIIQALCTQCNAEDNTLPIWETNAHRQPFTYIPLSTSGPPLTSRDPKAPVCRSTHPRPHPRCCSILLYPHHSQSPTHRPMPLNRIVPPSAPPLLLFLNSDVDQMPYQHPFLAPKTVALPHQRRNNVAAPALFTELAPNHRRPLPSLPPFSFHLPRLSYKGGFAYLYRAVSSRRLRDASLPLCSRMYNDLGSSGERWGRRQRELLWILPSSTTGKASETATRRFWWSGRSMSGMRRRVGLERD